MTQPLVAASERYGDFELVRYLTAGGMADLWLARSPRFPGDLVVKTIQPRYVEMTRVVKMFIDEGRIAQALDHPNIVKRARRRAARAARTSSPWSTSRGAICSRSCRRGVEVGNFLPRHLAVAILAQAARGLVYAHEKRADDGTPLRVVHCDISPGNIVVGWGGTVKMVDFGIARATIMLRESDRSVAGKYNYMAPEQIRGEAVDARADLFALGIILYELTVGKRLFRGRPEQVIRMVLDEPIPQADRAAPRLSGVARAHHHARARARSGAALPDGARSAHRSDGVAGRDRAVTRQAAHRRVHARHLRRARSSATPTSSPAASVTTTRSCSSSRRCRSRSRELVVDAEDPDPTSRTSTPRRRAKKCRIIAGRGRAGIGVAERTRPARRGHPRRPSRLPEPPTVRLRADETPKRVILPRARAAAPLRGGAVCSAFSAGASCVNISGRMRRPTMADKLSAFEVFPDRELKVGHPIVARLVGRKFDQLLDSGRYESRTTRASARRWSRRSPTSRPRSAPRSASPSAPSCRCTRWPTAATRGACCRASPARRRASCRCCSARWRRSRRASTSSRRTNRRRVLPLAPGRGQRPVDQSLLHARPVAVGRRRDRRAAHPRRARSRREGRALAAERARLRHGADLAASRRGGAHRRRSTTNGHSTGRLIVDLNLPNEDAWTEYLRQVLPQ